MALREEFEASGNWLFKWRSYLPFVLLIPMLIAFRQFDWPMHNYRLQVAWELFCFLVTAVGFAIRIYTVGRVPAGTSGRNTTKQIAASLNTTGFYSVVRHPLYLGNFLIWLGIAMFCLVWWFVLIFMLAFWLYYERIMFAEEEFLRRKFGKPYLAWATRTPAFLPNFSQWTSPTLAFSLRRTLRQEQSGLLGIVLGYLALDLLEHHAARQALFLEPHWVVLAVVGLPLYMTLWVLKKRTTYLNVEGR